MYIIGKKLDKGETITCDEANELLRYEEKYRKDIPEYVASWAWKMFFRSFYEK